MPYSHDAPKPWCLDRVAELAAKIDGPVHVLDVGPGSGAWGRLIRDRLDGLLELDCIEAHGPYVHRFGLDALYHHVFVGDVRQWDWGGCDYIQVAESSSPIGDGVPRCTWDLVILGDVLEHMTKDEARAVIGEALVHAPAVLTVVPIGVWPQGESEGNPLEAHVSTWSDEDIAALPKFHDSYAFWTEPPDAPGCFGMQITAALLGDWP